MTNEALFGGGEIWSKPQNGVSRLLSVLIHLTLLTVALIPWAASPAKFPTSLINVTLFAPPITPATILDHGGGGGGRHQQAPASLGKLPRAADRQMVPPDPEPPKNIDPTLVVEQSIVAPQLASLPQLNLISIGDPNGVPGPPSSGPGDGAGIGPGKGHGIGEGDGPGFGPGENGGSGGGAYHVVGGVSNPVLIYQPMPEYSEEARKARYEGMVVLDTIVREDGSVQVLRVVHSPGFRLDEMAIAAVLKWKFKPAKKNGKPVAAFLNVEVRFNLR